MIFGHLGLALLLKAKFYNKSLLWLIIFCYLPDLLFYLFYGIKWILESSYSPILTGVVRPLFSMTGTSISFVGYPIPLSHSIIIYGLFGVIFLLAFSIKKRSLVGLVFLVAVFGHLLFDFLLPEDIGVPIIYPFYPFNSTFFDPLVNMSISYHFLHIEYNVLFWLIDMSIFALGVLMSLWAFSKKSGRAEIPI